MARFARMLGTLLENGVPLLSAMQIARSSSGHPLLEADLFFFAAFGVATAAAYWLAFFPTRRYRRWVEASATS